MVSGQDDPVCLPDSDPAGGLQRLCGLVDEEGGEMVVGQDSIGRSDQRAGHHTGLVEEGCIDLDLQLRGPSSQTGESVAQGFPLCSASFAQSLLCLSNCFADAP